MNKYNFMLILIITIISKTILLPAQWTAIDTVEICSTYVNYATAYSNGHKVSPSGWDTIYAVYSYKEDTIHIAYSYDEGKTWQSQAFWATLWDNAHYPSLDVYDNSPWVVSEGDSTGIGEIFLMNPFVAGFPERISHTPGHSTLPDIVIDNTGNKHIVWQDNTPGNWDIYYKNTLSDTLNLSNDSVASDMYPSIGIFNGNEVHVIWERYDSTCKSPYSIVHRYLKEDIWSAEEFLAGPTEIPLHHPSLDFSHGEDSSLSAAWEDSSAGKLDAYFYGISGGNMPTSGNSRYPVISNIGYGWEGTLIYLYWEDNSDGYNDIYAHTYYATYGWFSYKFRDHFGDEDIHHPSVADYYLVWTQGDSPPYKVMFAIQLYSGIEEPETPTSLELKAFPNPFTKSTTIDLPPSAQENFRLKIYDITGTLIRELPANERTWDGRNANGETAKSGIYIFKANGYKPAKVIKLL